MEANNYIDNPTPAPQKRVRYLKGERTKQNRLNVSPKGSKRTKVFAKLRIEVTDAKHTETIQFAIDLQESIKAEKAKFQNLNKFKKETRMQYATRRALKKAKKQANKK